MIEDPLYLPKDTRVFILTSAQKDSHIIAKQKLVAEFRVFGYSPTIQYYPTVNQVANHELGFELPVRQERCWYEWCSSMVCILVSFVKSKEVRKTFYNSFF